MCLRCGAEDKFTGGVPGAYEYMSELEIEQGIRESGGSVVFSDGESLEELAEIEQRVESQHE
ncbi:MAG: hypothetical protein Q8O76_10235 [Chloroflexota bacterium]|nr:hypothetical protein [Chloroflexota bacterium]